MKTMTHFLDEYHSNIVCSGFNGNKVAAKESASKLFHDTYPDLPCYLSDVYIYPDDPDGNMFISVCVLQ